MLIAAGAARGDDTLYPVKDLAAELRQANCNGQPLVVMFGSSTCPYCHVVRSLFLEPLQRDSRYPGIVVRELHTDSSVGVKDFAGATASMGEIARRYGVTLVPVVLVFAPGGDIAGEPLVGISNEDFYSYYLDESIEAGVAAVSAEPSVLPAGYACD